MTRYMTWVLVLLSLGCGSNNGGTTNPLAAAGISGFVPPASSGVAGTAPAAVSGATAGTGSVAGTAGPSVGASGTASPAAGTSAATAGVGGASGAASTAGSSGNGGAQPAAGSGGAAGSMIGAAGASGATAGSAGSGGAAGNPMPGAGFPPVSDTSAKGPYTAVTIKNTGPNNAYTVFHPKELAPDGALNPVISWGNGAVTTPTDYPQLPHFASHGFVVVAANSSTVTAADVKAGLDWIVARNADSASPFFNKLDLKRIGGVGYSLGGLATLGNADDPRYVTLVIISGASMNDDSRMMNLPKLHTPVAYLCTADDASQGNCAGDYAAVKGPAFFGVMNGTAHTDVTSFLGLGVPAVITRIGGATTAWLRWQLMDDASQKNVFVGMDCGLCKDNNWTVKPQKNLN